MAQPGGAQNLSDSRDQAVQALLGSLAPGTENGSKLTTDQVKKLSEKIEELVGGVGSSDMGQTRNEKGELVNEEGLPIIEVTEPLNDADTNPVSKPMPIPEEPEFIPVVSLPAAERERQRIERERLLDMLEQEEIEQQRSNEAFSGAEPLQRESDVEKLKAAREMQKKMGKALLRNMADAREKEEKAKKESLLRDSAVDGQKRTLKPKKSVSFADLPDGGGGEPKDRTKIREKEAKLDWGDVAPGRLRSSQRSTLLTKAEMDRQPMKLEVVERLPSIPSVTEEQPPTPALADSDDESNPPSPTDSDEETMPGIGAGASDSPSSDDDVDLDTEDGEEEFDIDTARHHREIALEYYNKRNIIGKDAAAAMMSHSHDPDADDWDQPDVPLDATLSSPKPKPNVSRFKTDRMASSFSAASQASSSTSLGPSTLPASGYQTLQRAIRTGRLENDRLVGGDDGESASEPEDESVKEVLELLKKGEVHNLGPTLDPSIPNTDAPPSRPLATNKSGINGISGSSSQTQTQTQEVHESTVSTTKPKVSKFKLNRSQNSNHFRPESPATPTSTAGRSSPKMPPTSTSSAASTLNNSPQVGPTPLSMVVESPSFPPPGPPQPDASGRRLDRPPTIISAAVLESSGSRNTRPQNQNDGKERKVARFMEERT